MVQENGTARRHKRLALGLLCSALVLGGIWQGSAGAQVSSVTGSAYGYYASVSLFGGPAGVRGPDPTVTLPATGGDETASSPTGSAVYGPATIFSSNTLTASTEGTTGPDGSVTSTANVESVNTSGDEVFTASSVSSTCTASEGDASGSTTINGGTLRTSEGDPDAEGDDTVVDIPANPAPNTEHSGTIEAVGDNFRYVFNEQTVNPDGSITVNAAHLYLLGPTAVGELIIGQSVCGVSTDGGDDGGDGEVTTTTAAPSGETTSTTGAGGRGSGRANPAAPTPGEPRFTG